MISDTAPTEAPETDESGVGSDPQPRQPVLPQGDPSKIDAAPPPSAGPPTFGLALSGGGFRATLFHLGVIRYLRSEDLLGQVKVICSVSGGSVLAAHLILNWDRWKGLDHAYDEAEEEIRNFVTFGLRERIVRRLPFLIFFDRACMLIGIAIGMFIGGVLGLVHQGDFLDTRDTARSKQLMATLDAINHRMGRDTVFYAASGVKRDWAMAATMKSQHFTTDWRQLMQIKT